MTAYFISIDGVDGCGKTTQIGMLSDRMLKLGCPVKTVRDPGGTKLGESLREILLQRVEIPLTLTAEMLLYMASRSQLVDDVIIPALQEGRHVISDRFLLANVVYQGCASGLDPSEIWEVGAIATRGRMPDLTIVLDIDPELAMQRLSGAPDRLESRGLEYMRKVRDGFLEQGKRLGDRFEVIDAVGTADEIHQKVMERVYSKLAQLGC